MKKLLLTILMLTAGYSFSITVAGLLDFQGVWQSGTLYHNTPVLHTNKLGLATVTSNGKICVLQNESQESAIVLPESAPTVWNCN